MTITPAQRATLDEAEQSEAAALSLRKQAEAFEAEALALRASVYAELDAPPVVVPPIPPVVVPPIPPVVIPPIPPVNPPGSFDTLPTFKSGTPGAWSFYDLTGKRFNQQLNLRRYSFVHVTGGTYETPDTSFYCDGGSDIIVEAATFTGTPMLSSNTQRCRIINSTRVSMIGCTIIGGLATNGIDQSAPPPLDASGNVLGLGAGKGVNLDNCTDCNIRMCDISLVHKGITVGRSTVELSDNDIHDIRTTPISGVFGNGSAILGNHAWNSFTWGYGGSSDHGDFVHGWSENNTTVDGIIIEGNHFEQREGTAIMGIWLQPKSGDYTNATIRNNIVESSNGQGYRIEYLSGLVEGNKSVWTGVEPFHNNNPRMDIKAGCHDLLVRDNDCVVTVAAGLPPSVVVELKQ